MGVSVADWSMPVIALLGVLVTGWFGMKGYRSTTRADQERAGEALRKQLADARADERSRLDPLVRELERQLGEARQDRDYERARADGLQTLINQRQIGRD